jgi:hypothetical protein
MKDSTPDNLADAWRRRGGDAYRHWWPPSGPARHRDIVVGWQRMGGSVYEAEISLISLEVCSCRAYKHAST